MSFPVFKSAGEVFSGVTRHYFELLRAAPLMVLAYAVAALALSFLFAPATAAGLSEAEQQAAFKTVLIAQWPLMTVLFLVSIVSGFAAAVRWHRFVLIGERTGPIWGPHETRYLVTYIKMVLAAFVFFLCFSLLAVFVGVVTGHDNGLPTALRVVAMVAYVGASVLIMLWVTSVVLAFPDAAMGGAGKFGAIMDKTKGNTWRLLGYFIVVLFPVGLGLEFVSSVVAAIVKVLVSSGVASGLAGQELAVAGFLCLPLQIYVLMIGVTMLSVAYREIVGLPVASGETEVP